MILTAPAQIFLNTLDPTINTSTSIEVSLNDSASVLIELIEPQISTVKHNLIILSGSAEIRSTLILDLNIKTSSHSRLEDNISLPKRSWQARLGSRLDSVYKKNIDNILSNSGYPLDMLKVKINRDYRTQDLISRTVVNSKVLPIYFERALEDLPLRRLTEEDTGNIILTIDGKQLEDIEVRCPASEVLSRDDLLFRILRDDYSERDLVLVLQVKDELGTFGYSKLITVKYKLSYYDEKLPPKILNNIINISKKRGYLKW